MFGMEAHNSSDASYSTNGSVSANAATAGTPGTVGTQGTSLQREHKECNNIGDASYSSNEINKMGDRNMNSSRIDSSCDRQVSKQLRCLQNSGVNNSRDAKNSRNNSRS
jgi:hypothetical protein